MNLCQKTYLEKIEKIPFHGVGLSVDLHVPDLFELIEALDHNGLPFGYLEVFRAPYSHLQPLRDLFQNGVQLEYHADCLWYTQPEFHETPWEKECDKLIQDSQALRSRWITHECATKQISGYPFGTYLPPLLTKKSGELIGRQSGEIQNYLSDHWEEPGTTSPLLLVEVPPFYSFAIGDLPLSAFFRTIAERNNCGILLDIGHIYTYYLSGGGHASIPLDLFFNDFLEEFPLERVVQIHLGGLRSFHQTFVDDHGAKIPDILFHLLRKALEHPRLIHLKGIALEVDTKNIDLIIEEYGRFLSIGLEWRERDQGSR
jgi:hypothetical protein